MLNAKRNLASIIILVLALLLPSCGPTHPTEVSEFIRVKVDSVSLPAGIIHQTDTLVLKFYGVIGNDGCYSFAHYQGSATASRADIVVWGLHKTSYSGQICAQIIVNLDGRQFRIFPIQAGLYRINIHQPDGSTLSYSKEISQ